MIDKADLKRMFAPERVESIMKLADKNKDVSAPAAYFLTRSLQRMPLMAVQDHALAWLVIAQLPGSLCLIVWLAAYPAVLQGKLDYKEFCELMRASPCDD